MCGDEIIITGYELACKQVIAVVEEKPITAGGYQKHVLVAHGRNLLCANMSATVSKQAEASGFQARNSISFMGFK